MSRIQLYAINPLGDTVLLQLTEDSPVKMNLSVSELNPFTPSSFYSQTFRIPAVGPNVQFFQDAYSVNGYSFNPAQSASAWILNDGFLFAVGNLNLQSVFYNERTGVIEYECYFLGDTSDLVSEIGEGGLDQLDTSDLEHFINYENITKSWDAVVGTTGGLVDGNVVYPLCDWGYTYNNNNFPNESTVSVGFPQSFTRGITGGLELSQMKPATKIKWLWDKIFEQAGYTYESTFLESELFDNLYMVYDQEAQPEYAIPVGECQINAPVFRVGLGLTRVVPFSVTISDPNKVYNTEDHYWTCPQTGSYSLYGTGYAYPPSYQFAFPQAQFIVKLYADNTVINTPYTWITPIAVPGNTYFQGVQWSAGVTYTFTQGQKVYLTIENLTWSNVNVLFRDSQFAVVTSPADVQNMKQFLPDATVMKKIDFLKSITKMFNLVFEPSKTQQRKLIIEPWKDWILLGGVKDWTKYWDGNFDFQSSAVFLDQPRIVAFKGQMDEDFQNKAYQEQFKLDYAFRQFDSNIKLLKGTQDIEIGFGSTPLESIPKKTSPQYPDWVLPALARIQPGDPTEQRAGKVEPIQPKPRILFYNGKRSNPVDWYLMVDYPGVTGAAQDQYPLMSPYSEFPPNEFSTLQLSFQSEDALWSADSTYTGKVQNDLYTEYWSDFIDWIYDPFNRKINLTMRLDPLDVQSLRFNDKIWIKDSWYFVNKISDYPVGEVAQVKVELVKVPQAAIPGPLPTAATGGTAGTQCRQIALCNNYSFDEEFSEVAYQYVDCNNNLASVTIPNQTCWNPICMLYPFPNPLPAGFSFNDVGECGATGEDIVVELGITGNAFFDETTFLTISTATGPTGPYTPLNNFSYNTDNELFILTRVPDARYYMVTLSSTLATGASFNSSTIELFVNGSNVVTNTVSGSYAPNSAVFPSAINVLNDYGVTASFEY
jgi:hypothetical protein